MSENNQTYTIEEIKQAFWKTFKDVGEIYFCDIDDGIESGYNWNETEYQWNNFIEKLIG